MIHHGEEGPHLLIGEDLRNGRPIPAQNTDHIPITQALTLRGGRLVAFCPEEMVYGNAEIVSNFSKGISVDYYVRGAIPDHA